MDIHTMERNIKAKRQSGQAMIASVVFFVVLVVVVASGLVSPMARDYKTSNLNLQSKQTYYSSESGIEDVLYRLFSNIEVDENEVLSIGGGEVTTTAGRIDGVMHVGSFGDSNGINRELDLTLEEGYTASFDYSLQSGTGGFDITGGSSVIGSIFANGPVTGDSSSTITGSAVSANSPDFGLNQSNGTGAPGYDVIFAKTSGSQDIAQSFTVPVDTTLNQAHFYIKKVSTPNNIAVRLVSDSSGVPSTTTIASVTLSASS
ncbi:MAG: hypothetical protein KBC12_00005, partial [Candidatus Pacebacteria bacterium]|nr:hypothetical protein [Candidatus Paceibacterota bacterium]